MTQPLTDREAALVGRGGRLVYASAMVGTVVLPAVAANLSLPSVVVTVPSGIIIIEYT